MTGRVGSTVQRERFRASLLDAVDGIDIDELQTGVRVRARREDRRRAEPVVAALARELAALRAEVARVQAVLSTAG